MTTRWTPELQDAMDAEEAAGWAAARAVAAKGAEAAAALAAAPTIETYRGYALKRCDHPFYGDYPYRAQDDAGHGEYARTLEALRARVDANVAAIQAYEAYVAETRQEQAQEPLAQATRDEHDEHDARGEYGAAYGIGRVPADVDAAGEIAAAMAAAETMERLRQRGQPSAIIACPNCGAPTYSSQLMSASRGTACPRCYDDLSE